VDEHVRCENAHDLRAIMQTFGRLATMTSLGTMGTPDPQPGSLRGRRRLIPSVKPRLQTFDLAIAISASAPPPFAQHFQHRAQALSPLGEGIQVWADARYRADV
jgi:hypothetical protein